MEKTPKVTCRAFDVSIFDDKLNQTIYIKEKKDKKIKLLFHIRREYGK